MKVLVRKIADVNLYELKPLRISKHDPRFEEINGVYLRKDRLSTVVTVDHRGTILKVEGINPARLVEGENIYLS